MAKTLYTFNIYKNVEVEEEKQETVKNEAGVDTVRTYKEKVLKKIPVEILINQPNRRQMQEADEEFSVEMSRCIRAGILTKAMLLNKYSDTGGLISDSDAKTMVSATDEIREIHAKSTTLNLKPESERTEDDKKILTGYTEEIVKLRKQLVDKETSYITLFNHTADIKAQNKAILWYVLNLVQYKDNSEKSADFKPMFPGKDFKSREDKMFDLEDTKNEVYEKSFSKIASIVSYWFFTSNVDKEEFDRIVGEIDAPGTT